MLRTMLRSGRISLNALTNIVLVMATLGASGLLIKRQLGARAAPVAQAPFYLSNWKTFVPRGSQFGRPNAAVQIIELADFECPACGQFHRTLDAVRKTYGDSLAITFVHFPLAYHRFAMPASIAAVCASDQGRFEQMFDALYNRQDSLGLKTFSAFARDAGVTDIAQFEQCITKSDTAQSIRDGIALGSDIQVTGTPTVILNGWKLGRTPSAVELQAMILRVLKGQTPTAD